MLRAPPEFNAFYQSEYLRVLGLATALSGNRPTAEDLTQEAFSAAFKRWEEVSHMDHPEAWVRKVVANKAASRLRRLYAESRALVKTQPSRPDDSSTWADAVAVGSAVARLPRRQAEAVVLNYYSGLTHAEIADVMGCSIETTRTHLKRAKSRLAELLGESE